MNDARNKIEEFKKNNRFPGVGMAQLDIKLPEEYNSMGFHERNKAYEQALDKAIAKELKVELIDEETWPGDRDKAMTDEWVQGLPDAE